MRVRVRAIDCVDGGGGGKKFQTTSEQTRSEICSAFRDVLTLLTKLPRVCVRACARV